MASFVGVMAATSASASSASALAVGANPPTPGAAASYLISYIPATSQTTGSTISVVTAPGTTFSACASSCPDYKIAQGSNYKAITGVSVQAVDGSSTSNEFVIKLGSTSIQSGKSVTILAPGTNPTTPGTENLSIWTSKNMSPVNAIYTIGAPRVGLMQGAIPHAASAAELDLSSPTFLQTMFGTPTDSTPSLATAYVPNTNWTQLDGSTGSLAFLQRDGWSTSGNQPTPGYQLVLGVPMLPSKNGTVSLQAGANGAYNGYFRQLASTLIGEGLGNAWLRLGYEFDNKGLSGPTTPWGTGNSTSQLRYFAQYFQQIVTTMRAASGASFKFVWNPDGFAFLGSNDPEYTSSGGISLLTAWPGSQYVDYIGANVYDWQPTLFTGYTQAQNWANFIGPQLQAAEQFASSEGVPLAIPEWGVMTRGPVFPGMGDDPGYVNGMYCFMTNPANSVAWESYSNTVYSDWNTQITGSGFPNALRAFQQDFGQGSTSACTSG
ncbi:MAG TPA: hypothetical protein VHZ05_10990 [Acidimicrobiales bacterium]|nr:hypothetical protein [Acidimicrobiales bacterium]